MLIQRFRNPVKLRSCKVRDIVSLLVLLFLFAASAAAQETDANEIEWPSEANANSKLRIDRKEKPSKRFTRNKKSLITPVYKAKVQDVNGLIDPNLIIMAVKVECGKRWENYAIGKPLQCCDDNGKLVSYHVPVAIEVNNFPELLTPPPPNEINLRDLKDPELWGANEFWTFVVSARETDYPIPLYYSGLPPYLITFHKAAEIAKQSLGEETVIFTRYYDLGHRGDFYQFEVPSGDSVIINCHSLRIKDKKKVLVRAEGVVTKKAVMTREEKKINETKLKLYKEQVRKAWGEVKKKYENAQKKKNKASE